MNIQCKNCGHDHHISDDAVENRRIYFFCQNCGNKVVIDGRRTFLTGIAGSSSIREIRTLPSISHVLDIIPHFFYANTILLSLIYSIFVLIISGISGTIIFKNIEFFSSHVTFLEILSIFILSLLFYGYNILLYFISKLQFYVNDHSNTGIDWDFIFFDAREDLLSLLIISVGFAIVSLILFIPIELLGSYGILYASFTFPLSFLCVGIFIIALVLNNFIPAIIASRSLYIAETFKQIVQFIGREVLNIPFYLIVIEIVLLFVNTLFAGIFMVTLGVSILGVNLLLDASSSEKIMNIIVSLPALFTGNSQALSSIPSHMTAGVIFFFFIVFMLFLLLWSFIINVRQSLFAQATWIMQTNPGKSIPRNVMLIALITVFTLFVYVTSSTLLSKLIDLIKLQ